MLTSLTACDHNPPCRFEWQVQLIIVSTGGQLEQTIAPDWSQRPYPPGDARGVRLYRLSGNLIGIYERSTLSVFDPADSGRLVRTFDMDHGQSADPHGDGIIDVSNNVVSAVFGNGIPIPGVEVDPAEIRRLSLSGSSEVIYSEPMVQHDDVVAYSYFRHPVALSNGDVLAGRLHRSFKLIADSTGTHFITVSYQNDWDVIRIDGTTGLVADSVAIPDEPSFLEADANGRYLLVHDSPQSFLVDTSDDRIVAFDSGHSRAISPDGSSVVVVISGNAKPWQLYRTSTRVWQDISGSESAGGVSGMVFGSDGRLYVAETRQGEDGLIYRVISMPPDDHWRADVLWQAGQRDVSGIGTPLFLDSDRLAIPVTTQVSCGELHRF